MRPVAFCREKTLGAPTTTYFTLPGWKTRSFARVSYATIASKEALFKSKMNKVLLIFTCGTLFRLAMTGFTRSKIGVIRLSSLRSQSWGNLWAKRTWQSPWLPGAAQALSASETHGSLWSVVSKWALSTAITSIEMSGLNRLPSTKKGPMPARASKATSFTPLVGWNLVLATSWQI